LLKNSSQALYILDKSIVNPLCTCVASSSELRTSRSSDGAGAVSCGFREQPVTYLLFLIGEVLLFTFTVLFVVSVISL